MSDTDTPNAVPADDRAERLRLGAEIVRTLIDAANSTKSPTFPRPYDEPPSIDFQADRIVVHPSEEV